MNVLEKHAENSDKMFSSSNTTPQQVHPICQTNKMAYVITNCLFIITAMLKYLQCWRCTVSILFKHRLGLKILRIQREKLLSQVNEWEKFSLGRFYVWTHTEVNFPFCLSFFFLLSFLLYIFLYFPSLFSSFFIYLLLFLYFPFSLFSSFSISFLISFFSLFFLYLLSSFSLLSSFFASFLSF